MKKRKAILFNNWLKKELKNDEFKKVFNEEDIRAKLAYLIAQKRQKKGISQAKLAQKIHTTQQVISDIETLKHANITLHTLQKIAHALGSRIDISLK